MTRRSPVTSAHHRPRHYNDAELALFAAYTDSRIPYRPTQCTKHSPCWVTDGPPAMTGSHNGTRQCVGCHAPPRLTAKPRQ